MSDLLHGQGEQPRDGRFYTLAAGRRGENDYNNVFPRWRVLRMNDLRRVPIRRRGLQLYTPWFWVQVRPPKWGGWGG